MTLEDEIKYSPLGDHAILISFEDEVSEKVNDKVIELIRKIEASDHISVQELIPAYQSLTVVFNPFEVSYLSLIEEIKVLKHLKLPGKATASKVVSIPVCYDKDFALDLTEVAKTCGLNELDIIDIHSKGEYRVYMTGFTPGFMYLGMLDARIQVERKSNPKLKVRAGSIAIANAQTGIYSFDSPGGWNIIGCTPVQLIDTDHLDQPMATIGDRVRFFPITKAEFEHWGQDE